MGRILKLLPFFFFSFRLAAEPRSFHFYGWSEEGTFSWFEKGGDDRGRYYRFQMIDLVTDETILDEKVYSNTGDPRALSDEIARRFTGPLQELGINTSLMGESFGAEGFDYQGKSYRVLISEDEGSKVLRILNLSSNSFKDISRLDKESSWNLELLGGLVSPYEKRACLVVRYPWGGHKVFGAHLTIGFRSNQYQAGELVESVLCGQYYITRQLLDRGVPVETKDNRGYSVLLLAARNGKWDIAELLLDRGANTDVRDGRGKSPADYAAEAGKGESFVIRFRR